MHLGNLSQMILSNMWLIVLILSQTGICSTFRWSWHSVCLHLMWNMELNTLNYFLDFPANDLGYLDPVSPKSDIIPKVPKNKSNSIPRWLCQSSKTLKFWITFSCAVTHDLEYLDLVFPNCPNVPRTIV